VKNLCLQERNPDENKRSYSSVFNNDQIGTGHAQSKLDCSEAWSAGKNDNNQWIKIDLDYEMNIIGIIIQIRGNYMYAYQFVKDYTVEYSSNNFDFIDTNKIYIGVTNTDDISRKFYDYVPNPIKARYIKVNPKNYNRHISLRIGILIDTNNDNCMPIKENFFYDFLIKVIKPCNNDISYDSEDCSTCKGYLHYNLITKCIKEKYFLNGDNILICDDSCRTCETNALNCKSCDNSLGYYNVQNLPLNECKKDPPGYYLDASSKIYIICENNCETCLDRADNCIICRAGFYKLKNSNSGEINKCHSPDLFPNYFIESNSLTPCDTSCNGCSINSKNCNICNTGFFSKQYALEQEQKFCFILTDGLYLDSSNKLNSCDVSCKTCDLNNKNCLICSDVYYKKYDEKVELKNYCYNEYPGYFLDILIKTLKKCDVSCKECRLEANNCTICSDNFYKSANVDELLKDYCTNVTDGSYFNTEDSLIYKCDISCKKCENLPKNCLECSPDYYFLSENNSETNKNCFKDFPGHYLDTTNNILKSCGTSCVECESTETECVVLPCNESCLKCKNSPDFCIQCNTNFYALEDNEENCVSSCPGGTYLNLFSSECMKCKPECKICKDEDKCIECNDNYSLEVNQEKCILKENKPNSNTNLDNEKEDIEEKEKIEGILIIFYHFNHLRFYSNNSKKFNN